MGNKKNLITIGIGITLIALFGFLYISHDFFFLFILLASSVVIGQAESTRCLSSCTTELTPYGTPS